MDSRTNIKGYSALLDAAEEVFGSNGFDGAGMRLIAEKAGVAPALVHYHFKSKDLLYEAVFERRAETIHSARQRQLDKLSESDAELKLESILRIMFTPLEDLIDAPRGDFRFYLQMVADVAVSSHPRSIAIVKRFYDPSAEQFVEAFQRALPGLSRDKAVWCYLFALGSRAQAHSPSGRASRLGVTREARWSYELLIPYTAAGIRAVVDSDIK